MWPRSLLGRLDAATDQEQDPPSGGTGPGAGCRCKAGRGCVAGASMVAAGLRTAAPPPQSRYTETCSAQAQPTGEVVDVSVEVGHGGHHVGRLTRGPPS